MGMTMKMAHERFKSSYKFYRDIGLDELIDWMSHRERVFETLWREGYVQYFDDNFLSMANGYQIATGDYTDVHINQTLDLHSITVTKKGTLAMLTWFFEH